MFRALLSVLVLSFTMVTTASESVVVYSGRAEKLMTPIFEAARAATGLTIDVRYGATPALAAQIAAEGAQSPCDVVLAQEAGYLAALAEAGQLAVLDSTISERVDTRFRDAQNRWIGTSGRLRVLVVDGGIPAAERPQSLTELADARWQGQVGWAPGNASFQAHVSVLRAIWGEARTRTWLEAMKANGTRVYEKNSPQVAAVDRGEIRIGWVNHYYLHQARTQGPGLAVNQSFPSSAAEGNVLMVSGVGRIQHSTKPAAADRLIAWLVSDEAQTLFAAGFEYPVVPGVAPVAGVAPLESVVLTTVDQRILVDLAATLDLLRSVGLQ